MPGHLTQPAAGVLPPGDRFAGRLLSNTLWMTAGLGLKPFVQAVYAVVLIRCLGPSAYGVFITCFAVLAIASPFAAWGSGVLVIKRLNEPNARGIAHALGCGITLILLFGGLSLLLATSIASALALPALPLLAVFIFAASELVLGKLQELCWQTYQALERLHRTSQIQFAQVMIRLVAAVVFAAAGHHDLTSWALFYGASSVVSAAACLALVIGELGMPRVRWRDLRHDFRDGFWFAAGLSSQNIYNDVDKPLVAALAGSAAAGVYGAAYRILDACFTPVRALLYSTHPEFFKSGRSDQTARLSVHLLSRVVGAALLASGCVLVATRFIAPVLGEAYAPAADALLILSAIPIARALHNLAGDALTGSGLQPYRTSLQLACAALTVVLGISVIGNYSWRGAAFLSLGMDIGLAVAMWITLWTVSQRRCSTPIAVS